MNDFFLKDRSENELPDYYKNIAKEISSFNEEQLRLLYQGIAALETGDIPEIDAIFFTKQPPTPEEFLDPRNGWLTVDFCSKIFPELKEDFLNIFDKKKKINSVCWYGATGLGKSVCLRLATMYSTIWFHHLRHPNAYFDILSTTSLCMYFVSYKMDKSRQLLLEPIFKLFRESPRFEHINLSAKVFDKQAKDPYGKIYWSKAAYNKDGCITLNSGLKYYIGNDNPDEIRGADLWQYYVTEISYFTQQDGISEDQVMKLIVDARNRVYRTMPNKHYAWTWIDTSARAKSSIIEKYINNTLRHDKKCYFTDRRRWDIEDLRSKQAKKYYADPSQVFEIITGDGAIPPKIITSPIDKEGVPKDLIQKVPIDYFDFFDLDLVTSIRDIGGWPTSDDSKFIPDTRKIERIFDDSLPNVISTLICDAGDNPDRLIWNQIHSLIFNFTTQQRYILKRCPKELRFLGIDLAKSSKGDLLGISMVHKEYSSLTKQTYYVADFSFAIAPGDTGINLQAVEEFIMDLLRLGEVPINMIYLDTALSAQLLQNLNRRISRNENICVNNSVDRTMDDYQYILNPLQNGALKVGRNIILKNNLICLERRMSDKGKEYIDHPKGDVTFSYNGNWEESTCGYNMKDVSDSLVQAIGAARKHTGLPYSIFEEQNQKLVPTTAMVQANIKSAFDKIKYKK